MEKEALQVDVSGGTGKFGFFCMTICNRIMESVSLESLQYYTTAGPSYAGHS